MYRLKSPTDMPLWIIQTNVMKTDDMPHFSHLQHWWLVS